MVTLSYRPDLGMADGRPSLVFIMADHQRADSLGQHRMYRKNELYEQAIRVPLLSTFPAPGRARFDSPISRLDVMPTVLALTGATAPTDLDGVSLGECVVSGTLPPERLDPLEMDNLASEGRGTEVVEWLRREAGAWARAHGDWLDFT